MAQPVHKRRKVDHTSSSDDDGDDNASFASFENDDAGTDEEENLSQEELGSETDRDEDDDSEDEDMEIDKTGLANGALTRKSADADKSRSAQNGRQRKPAVTAEELALSSGSFKSNMFKLQVEELLRQIRPRSGQLDTAAGSALQALKSSLEAIPDSGPFTLDQAERHLIKQKVAVPFPSPRPPKDSKYKFAYIKPASVNVTGSFALKTSPRSSDGIEVDMIATMPSSLFEDKDYLNHRYFYKRAFYLASIAAGLRSAHKQDYKFRFTLFRGDALKPILTVAPNEQTAANGERTPTPKWRINIIPCISQDRFAVEKLGLAKNCVRALHNGGISSDGQLEPTPFYNASLRSDMLMSTYLTLLHRTQKTCEAFIDVCLLGGTWLRQRGFASTIAQGGFGHFEWAALVALCLNGGGPGGRPLLSSGYSSYQLFKATLQLLAVKDFCKQPMVIGSASSRLTPLRGCPTVWDGDRHHNILYKMQQWSYKLLRQEAKNTLSALGDANFDGFDATFIQRACDPLLRFDQVFELPLAQLLASAKDHDERTATQKLSEMLFRGFGDRVTQISINSPSRESWALGSSQGVPKGNVAIGLVVNQATVERIVDHGPSAEAKAEAASFREFWGEKAELRRFKDGSILESLVWDAPSGGQTVVEQIFRFLIGRHFTPTVAKEISSLGQSLEKLVPGGFEQTGFAPNMEAFTRFENDVRGLTELPLSIRDIVPADAQLRYSSVSVGRSAQRSTPANVVLQFEGSARWPDDLAAIQRTKIAFLLRLRELLIESVDNATCRIGLENEGSDVLNQAYLDVSYEGSLTFRLRIHHDREHTLLERKLKDKSSDPKSKEIAAVGLARYKQDYLKTPAHTGAVARLCTRYPALSGAIRLMKKWFAAHLLSNHFAEEIIELLVVQTFTRPWPWQMPSSAQTGFLRTLWWVSRWDWREAPLIVDVSGNSELKPPAVKAITTRFDAWRKLDPALNRLAIFIATNLDHDGNTWTDVQPAAVVAGRMTALARAACSEMTSKQMSLDLTTLFSSPLSDFNFVLHLNKKICGGARVKLGQDSYFKNLELAALDDTNTIGYDPAQDYLQELETVFGSAVVFFNGGSERLFIAGLWRPQTATRSWKVNLAYSTIPIVRTDSEDALAEINKKAMLAEMARLGGDLVSKVEMC